MHLSIECVCVTFLKDDVTLNKSRSPNVLNSTTFKVFLFIIVTNVKRRYCNHIKFHASKFS